MPLNLEQYAAYLDTRSDLSWPPPPEVERPKVRPHLEQLSGVRAVLFNVYGTLLAITGGDLLFEHPRDFVMNLALERTIQEFKMWGSMSRKPGQPSEYMRQIYEQVLLEKRSAPSGAGNLPLEVLSEKVWEAILKRLLQKDYKFDAGFFGSLNEFSKKVAYFFHQCLQGYACYDNAVAMLRGLGEKGVLLGLAADGQCFTSVQLQKALARQVADAEAETLFADDLVLYSCDARFRSSSDKLLRPLLEKLARGGVEAGEVLYITSRLPAVATAKRLGLKTALFGGDKASLQATPEQIREIATRPDVLLGDLIQLLEVV